MLISIIRHGESEGNKKRVFGEQFSLTEKGRKQARWLGSYLAARCPNRLYSSPLPRALETAEIVCQAVRLSKVEVAEPLREIRYGTFENLAYDLGMQKRPAVFSRDPSTIMTVAYPGGEKHSDVFARADSWLSSVREDWNKDTSIVIVTHSLVAKMLLTILLRAHDSLFVQLGITNGSVSTVEVLNGVAYLKEFNRHL